MGDRLRTGFPKCQNIAQKRYMNLYTLVSKIHRRHAKIACRGTIVFAIVYTLLAWTMSFPCRLRIAEAAPGLNGQKGDMDIDCSVPRCRLGQSIAIRQ